MEEKWGELHLEILSSIHSLIFNGYGLRGDVNEKLLRNWYEGSYGVKGRIEVLMKEYEAALSNKNEE